MKFMKYLFSLCKPAKWHYCQLDADGNVVYGDSSISWLRWAKTKTPIIDSIESFHGDTQIAVLVEFRGCDSRFARTKRPSLRRFFYRVSVLGGPLDGRTGDVRTLDHAQKLMREWNWTSMNILDAQSP